MPDGTIKPGKASRHTVKKKQLIYEVKKEMRPGERVAKTNMFGGFKRDTWGDIIYDYGPDREVVTKKKLVSEGLVVKRLSKKGAGKKESSTRQRGSRKYGSSASIRSMAKKSKIKRKKRRGGRTKKEKRKQKKKKK